LKGREPEKSSKISGKTWKQNRKCVEKKTEKSGLEGGIRALKEEVESNREGGGISPAGFEGRGKGNSARIHCAGGKKKTESVPDVE